YGMLDADERRLFDVLAVFSGATFAAVDDVTSEVKGMTEIDALDGLSSLVDKSLVRQLEQPDGSRFVMLETIREFAAARLEDDDELSVAARRAHATYFADWTQRQWEPLTGEERERASNQLVADIENVRAAWRYWVAEGDFE